MNNRIKDFLETPEVPDYRPEDALRIDAVLEELFSQYERRFSSLRIAVLETPVAAGRCPPYWQ